MAGSLIKIDEEIVTSAVASVTLTGIDSTYDVYKLVVSNLTVGTDGSYLYGRVTEGGTPNSSGNYAYAAKFLRADNTFTNLSHAARSVFAMTERTEITNGFCNGIFYLFNFANASEFSFMTIEEVHIQYQLTTIRGQQGGAVFKQASACDGIQLFLIDNSGNPANIASGTFTLYGLKK